MAVPSLLKLTVGQMWRAFDLMVKRATERQVHGGLLEDKQFIQGFIADSYIDIQASRLMTIRTAEIMEQGGDARTDISAIKVFVPNALARVVDRAIQVHGAMGVSGDTPLAGMFLGARASPCRRPGRSASHIDCEERAACLSQRPRLGRGIRGLRDCPLLGTVPNLGD